MKTLKSPKSQRGQAMSEFIAAMLLFVPLTFAIIYIGKYSDIKHQAIQASRYAAMQRAFDPHSQEQSDTIKNDTVARFFRDGSKEVIANHEVAAGNTRGDLNPNWYTVPGDAMIAGYDKVHVNLDPTGIKNAVASNINQVSRFDRLEGDFGFTARVDVDVAKIMHFDPLDALNVNISASTVVAGDPWVGGGTQDVADRFGVTNVPARGPGILGSLKSIIEDVLDPLFESLAGTPAPRFGCIKPDITPKRVSPGAVYNPEADPSDPGIDHCY